MKSAFDLRKSNLWQLMMIHDCLRTKKAQQMAMNDEKAFNVAFLLFIRYEYNIHIIIMELMVNLNIKWT